jgi:hypothetical protein
MFSLGHYHYQGGALRRLLIHAIEEPKQRDHEKSTANPEQPTEQPGHPTEARCCGDVNCGCHHRRGLPDHRQREIGRTRLRESGRLDKRRHQYRHHSPDAELKCDRRTHPRLPSIPPASKQRSQNLDDPPTTRLRISAMARTPVIGRASSRSPRLSACHMPPVGNRVNPIGCIVNLSSCLMMNGLIP